jgi:recombinase
VRRIFRAYIDGNGDRAIATMLNEEGIPCPSALRPEQNRHRQADGWQGGTVRSILDNPRYTGYAVFGRWARREMLLNPDDVAAGHVTRFRRAAPDRIVRSREPAHPAIVSVEEFTAAQLLRRTKNAGGLATARKAERGKRRERRTYVLRGMVRCGVCHRRMAGEMVRQHAFYRCASRTMAPGSAALADHPATVNLREDMLISALNGWIDELFLPENIDATVATLVGSQPDGGPSVNVEAAKARRADADQRVRRFQAAIAAGVDPASMVDAINQAQAERTAAQSEIDTAQTSEAALDLAEVYAMIDSLGDIGAVLGEAKPASLQRLYQALSVQVQYEPAERAAYVTATPRVDSAGVRGGT